MSQPLPPISVGSPWIRIHYDTPELSNDQRQTLQGALVLAASEPFLPSCKVAEVVLPQGSRSLEELTEEQGLGSSQELLCSA